MKHYIFGDFVFTSIPNAFNSKLSFWLTKKGCIKALYCFSVRPGDEKEIERQLKEKNSYFIYFDHFFIKE